ncbi:MAG TPA: sialidase family protein [Chthoniobacterales bacterium]
MRWHEDVGIVAAKGVEVQSIRIDGFTCHPRAIRLPDGEFLLFVTAGPRHYGWAKKEMKGNEVFLYRSQDGWNWSAPEQPWSVPYSQHAPVPFRPSDSDELLAFGTEPEPNHYDGEENAAIGFRRSQDGGRSWSEVRLIAPRNAVDFLGMAAMRLCETADGSWLLGSHVGRWSGIEGVDRKVVTRQFLLRSEDRGASWDLLPGPWPQGWQTPGTERMDEGRPIHLGENRVLFLLRTPTGFLWEMRSADAGRTWTDPQPTTLRHPDAPPMIFHLDEKTLAVFHHNRAVSGAFAHESRTELWLSISQDEGRTWSEPRFLMANACQPAIFDGWGGFTSMISYVDLLVEGDWLHLFVDHQMRQVVQASFHRGAIGFLPDRNQLMGAWSAVGEIAFMPAC